MCILTKIVMSLHRISSELFTESEPGLTELMACMTNNIQYLMCPDRRLGWAWMSNYTTLFYVYVIIYPRLTCVADVVNIC